MLSSKAALYRFVLIVCLIVFGWVGYNLMSVQQSGVPAPQICLLKRTTDIPCPFCGTTRAVMYSVQGEFVAAFFSNPIGILVALFVTVVPIWILVDAIFRRDTFFKTFSKAVAKISRKQLLLLTSLLLVVWLWNIARGV